MAGKLTIEYDRIGDILYVRTCKAYIGQVSDLIGDDIVARFHPVTGEIESFEIQFFLARSKGDEAEEGGVELPVHATLQAVEDDATVEDEDSVEPAGKSHGA